MIPDADLRTAVARLLHDRLAGDQRFVSRTGARGFLRLTRSSSRIGGDMATASPVSGGLRFSTKDRVVVIERCHSGYRVLVRASVAGEALALYDSVHEDVDSIGETLLDVLGTVQAGPEQ